MQFLQKVHKCMHDGEIVPVLQNYIMNVGIYQFNTASSLHETEIKLCSFGKKNLIITQKDWNIS
jgi:hypothetical protein